jgi:hypothetical protein
MPIYHQRICNSAGRILNSANMEFSGLQQAMAKANMDVRKMMKQRQKRLFDPKGRIDILDCEGHILARVYCAEVIAASR